MKILCEGDNDSVLGKVVSENFSLTKYVRLLLFYEFFCRPIKLPTSKDLMLVQYSANIIIIHFFNALLSGS